MNTEKVWQQYGHSLRAFLHSKISDPHEVEDLLQEILIKTHRNMGSLRASDKLKPWLFQLANNTVIDFYRKRGKDRSIDPEVLWYDEDEPQVQEQLSDCVLPFIDALPAETAQLLKAIDIEGRSQKEYAEEKGISYSTVKSRVQRGRLKLRVLFEQCCHMDLDRQGRVIEYRARTGQCDNC
ncbi:RNA polymerase sigma factor SigZ [Pontibacterium sp.]|uniref:RNA polymerase sigma factor SigZ n=1 Tax=Pontibacterium sp. TaxID=2036026 RepID=UPI00351456DA